MGFDMGGWRQISIDVGLNLVSTGKRYRDRCWSYDLREEREAKELNIHDTESGVYLTSSKYFVTIIFT
jgi:hypothetical protein